MKTSKDTPGSEFNWSAHSRTPVVPRFADLRHNQYPNAIPEVGKIK